MVKKQPCFCLKPGFPDSKVDVFCVEAEFDTYHCCVVNHGYYCRAAVVNPEHTQVLKWLGRKCRKDLVPRRQAANFAFDENEKLIKRPLSS